MRDHPDNDLWGTTSACAENTLRCQRHPVRNWNYLRVRGEYVGCGSKQRVGCELPPRARRIPTDSPPRPGDIGTTSACAENTSQPFTNGSNIWNYLRVRGEYKGLCLVW